MLPLVVNFKDFFWYRLLYFKASLLASHSCTFKYMAAMKKFILCKRASVTALTCIHDFSFEG
jgi:hypothetical protein